MVMLLGKWDFNFMHSASTYNYIGIFGGLWFKMPIWIIKKDVFVYMDFIYQLPTSLQAHKYCLFICLQECGEGKTPEK